MGYKKTDFKDTLRDNGGNIIQRGTPLNAQVMGKIEDGIIGAEQKIDTEIEKVTSQLDQTNDEVDKKVERVEGKQLSTNDFTTTEKTLVAQIPQLARQDFVDAQFASIVSGSPKATYATLDALKTAYPSGTDGTFLVLANGHWYYWNETVNDWLSGGLFQAQGIADGEVDTFKLQSGLSKKFSIFPKWSDFTNQTHNTTIGSQDGFSYSVTSGRVNHIDVASGQNLVSKKITVQNGSILSIHNRSVFKVYLLEINLNGEIIKVSPFLNHNEKYTLQNTTSFIRFLTRRSDDTAFSIKDLKLANVVITTNNLVANLDSEVEIMETDNLISLLSRNWEIGGKTATIGEPSIDVVLQNRLRHKEPIIVFPNTYYTITAHNPNTQFSTVSVTSEGKVIQNPIMRTGSFTFRTSSETAYIWLIAGFVGNPTVSLDDVTNLKIKFEKSDTSSEFSYSPSDLSVKTDVEIDEQAIVNNVITAVETEISSVVETEVYSKVSAIEYEICKRTLFPINKVYYIGHRGYGDNDEIPEQTIPSFLKAGEVGYWGAEFDIRATSDGHLIVIHDITVDRTTDGTGNVADMTLAQIKDLNVDTHPAYAGTKIPTFEEVLVTCKRMGLIPVVHVGGAISDFATLVTKMIDTLAEYGFDKSAIILSDKTAMMRIIRERLPFIHLQVMLASADDTTRIDLAKNLKGSVSINHALIPNREWVLGLQQQNLLVASWIVTAQTHQTLLEYGLDMLSFDEKIW